MDKLRNFNFFKEKKKMSRATLDLEEFIQAIREIHTNELKIRKRKRQLIRVPRFVLEELGIFDYFMEYFSELPEEVHDEDEDNNSNHD